MVTRLANRGLAVDLNRRSRPRGQNRGAAGPTFDAVLAAACEDRSGEQALDQLVRTVLRSTLEQLCSRQAAVPGGRQPK
jgi:hypothetical protein